MVKRFNDHSKKLILHVYEYFRKQSIEKKDPKVTEEMIVSQTAEALKISTRSLYRLKKPTKSDSEFRASMSKKIKELKTKINPIMQSSIREIVYKMFAEKKHVTMKSLHSRFMEENPDFKCCVKSIHTWVRQIGFKFRKNDNRKFLMERPCIQIKRRHFLRQYLRHKRMQLYQPVVLDETWVFSKGGNRKSWQDGSMATTSKKTGDGCRYIVLHAGKEDGFVENAGLIFKSTTRSGDYHDNMNRKNFEKWFKTELIPNLEQPSLIIMDNASYHSGLQEEIPIKSWTKKKMKEWLQKKNITFSLSDMKDQIWKIVSCNLPEKVYHLDQYAEEQGHSVLRLPPYHCHFNAIEMVWSECKRLYDEEIIKTRSTVDDVLKIWNVAIKQVSAEHWKNYVAHTEKVINAAWETEKRLDVVDVEPMIINTNGDSDSDSSDFDSDCCEDENM